MMDAPMYSLPPSLAKVPAIRRIYPDLYRREVRPIRMGGDAVKPDRFVSWEHLRRMARNRWVRQHPAATRAASVRFLDEHPTPEGNQQLARLLLNDSQYRALDVIADGESAWRENVWNGGAIGAWPDRHPGARGCVAGAAYGIGQACPRYKMEAWARDAGYRNPARIYTSPKLQILWAVFGYAPAVHGSIEKAAAQWTAGGRNGRTW
jgi:hypothetical protein